MRAYVGLFRLPGYPYLATEITAVLDKADRVLGNADDDLTVQTALNLADVLEQAAHVVRDVAADAIFQQQQAAS